MSNRRTYVRVYDDLTDHGAWMDLDPEHVGVWLLALVYCSRNLSDGHFPLKVVRRWGGTDETVQQLVDAGRLHAPGHGCVTCPEVELGKLYVHDYLEHQRSRDHVQDVSAKRREAGRAGGLARVAKQSANQVGDQVSSPPKQNQAKVKPYTETETEETPAADAAAFTAWWAEYPRKVGKDAAERAYVKAAKRATDAEMLEGLRNATQVWTATHTDPKFIPHAATWLNAGRWADEVTLPSMPDRDPSATLRPRTTVNQCDGTTCPGVRHEWTDNRGRNAFVCMGATA